MRTFGRHEIARKCVISKAVRGRRNRVRLVRNAHQNSFQTVSRPSHEHTKRGTTFASGSHEIGESDRI